MSDDDDVRIMMIYTLDEGGPPKKHFVRSTPSGKLVANIDIDKFHLRGRTFGHSFGGALTPQRELCSVLPDKTNHPVERLSLSISQCGSCSTKYDIPAGT